MLSSLEVINLIFKDPAVLHSLSEFEDIGIPVEDALEITERVIQSGKYAGSLAYYVKTLITTRSGLSEYFVYSAETGQSAPEEIVRQLWLKKLMTTYGYPAEQLDIEVPVHFGTEIHPKAADIVVYTDRSKSTAKIIVECKQPDSAEGIEQLKSYMNSKGAPSAVWSNGADRITLYRSVKGNFDDTLPDLPKNGQSLQEVLEAPITIDDLRETFNFKRVIQDLEELVLADSGTDEFNEIFKLIFAKIWDEKSASKTKGKTTRFRKSVEPEKTYTAINTLFAEACEEWPGIFDDDQDIELAARHLQVCIGPLEKLRFMGSNLRIMDDAFEYLLPSEAKKKKGQFFTPRPVIEMCVRMLNPKSGEFVMDPACGSGGFLLHTMDWVFPAHTMEQREQRKSEYASRYLWGIDFEKRAAKTSRALMLIAGDGHTNIFGPDVNSIDPRTWYDNTSGQELIRGLKKHKKLVQAKIPAGDPLLDRDRAWEYFQHLNFDIVLANPPFAGEIKDSQTLAHYELAGPAIRRAKGKRQVKEERDVLFIERIIDMLKPGGRAAVVLPQGKFNNPSLSYIREWILNKARILGVVGLHQNTFKPHTGTKTSVLLLQKYTHSELAEHAALSKTIALKCPDIKNDLRQILAEVHGDDDIPTESIPGLVFDVFDAAFPEPFDPADYADESGEIRGREEMKSSSEQAAANVRAQIVEIEKALKTEAAGLQVAIASVKTAPDRVDQVKRLRDKHREKAAADKAKLKELGSEHLALVDILNRIRVDEARETNRGQAQLFFDTPDLISDYKTKWIANETLKALDYPVFMAVSERGGKDSSGNYTYIYKSVDDATKRDSLGHILVDQDLVNFELDKRDLENIAGIPASDLDIAEQFILFAKEQNLSFWTQP
ncbi:N-6 DNA methylase [Subtercola sp. PAMC28395]|uniref:N-6 DNA methylase n=1 Tax=Subtercola sp. PAMC28395 TaxID=2846775 RepID=UPI001C0B8BE9|nr:N-6 DNA methylase [Subtercola sp. PAMC28395]QWT24210.1 N-6 DNA methylase [Subtercola sp. PAMC28395]